METIKACIAYKNKETGEVYSDFPLCEDMANLEPVYKEFTGWKTERSRCRDARSRKDLPANAKEYLNFIEETLGVSIDIIGVGPDREEIIIDKSPFARAKAAV
jgi:adenylosuccinate synthase